MNRREYIWQTLPYGLWIDRDGREILFNRRYCPIWQRSGKNVSAADLKEWVEWRFQDWFWKGDCFPAERKAEEVLAAFMDGEDVKGRLNGEAWNRQTPMKQPEWWRPRNES
jgi:hypothetical protein